MVASRIGIGSAGAAVRREKLLRRRLDACTRLGEGPCASEALGEVDRLQVRDGGDCV